MKVGLALSGGAAHGIAHIGVLKYLEEKQVKPCCVAGTSAGSIVGAMYCSGIELEEIKKIAEKISWKDILAFSIPRKGLIESSRLLKILKEYLGELEFSDLKIPFMVNAVDLLSGEEVVFKEGNVAEAVHASCAIPGIFTPVRLGDHLLVDGGLLNNVPVTVLKDFDLDYLIAVDVGSELPFQKNPDSIFEIIMQSFEIIRRHRDKPALEHADIIIEPELGDIKIWDISKIDLLIERGYEAASKSLNDIDLHKEQGKIARWFSRRRKKKEG